MAAFDRVLSGIPEMDTAFDNIRLGDNVVWRVSDLSQFRLFMEPYVEQAIRDRRNIIYFRFAGHEPLVADRPEVKTVRLPLSHRFETFTVDIHNVIEQEGKDAYYVFDCLSDLQTAWATDLMMGNFFRVTCPFLFILDTVAFFPIIRGKHSVQAINKILNTTQLFIDVYGDSRSIYVRPEKVWNRNSDTMFLPHTYEPETGRFRPILDGVKSSRFYQTLGLAQRSAEEQVADSWDRFFSRTKLLHENGIDITEECGRMCNIMMTRDEKMRAMVKKHFTPEDYFAVRDHMIGTGMIGGKACGMLLARAIIRNTEPEISEVLEPHGQRPLGNPGPAADGGRILHPGGGIRGKADERNLFGQHAGAVCPDYRVLRAGSVYRPVQQHPGGRFRKRVRGEIRIGFLREPGRAEGPPGGV